MKVKDVFEWIGDRKVGDVASVMFAAAGIAWTLGWIYEIKKSKKMWVKKETN